MTREQWKDRSFRKFKNRTAFITFIIHGDNQCVVDLSQVESVEWPTIDFQRPYPGSRTQSTEIKLYSKCVMKSGKEIMATKTFPAMYNEEQVTNWFGKVKTVRVPFTHQEYFDFIRKNPDHEMAVFHNHLENLRIAFVNNVCVERN